MATLHDYSYEQDGADFYVYDGPDLEAVVSYPHGHVGLSLDAAMKARTWFDQLMHDWGVSCPHRSTKEGG